MTLTITHKYLRNLLDNLNEDNYDDFLVELQYSTLIVPVTDWNEVPVIEEKYLPLFTDLNEFDRFSSDGEYHPVDHDFNYYLELLIRNEAPGFVINPDSENFRFSDEILERIEPNYIFDQEYDVFTTNEIRKLKNSIKNDDLNDFLKDPSNRWDLDTLIEKVNHSLLLTLLISDEDYSYKAEGGVISPLEPIPKCIFEVGGKNYLLLFSRELTINSISDEVFMYSQLVNFPLLVESVLNHDLDGFILNVDEENITIPREKLRDFMKGFSMPLLSDFSMYSFTVEEEEQ